MGKFSDHVEPKVNAYLARFQLSQLKQHSDEAVDNFIARCRVAAANCKFADIVEMNTRLIEQLIIGTQHDYVRGKLLERGDGLASLNEAMDIARTFETTKAHVAQFQSYGSSSSSSATVHGLRREMTHEGCTRCGRRHPAQGFCPAKGSTCRRCGRKNHWDIVCTATEQTAEKEGRQHGYQQSSRGTAKSSHVRGKATVSTIVECPDVDADSTVFQTISMHMDSMGDAQNGARDQVFVNLALRDVTWNGRPTELREKVDTGAQGNVLPLRIYQKMFPDRVDKNGQPIRNFLEKSSVRLVSYGATLINQIGVCTLTCTYQQTRRETRFFVTDAPGPAIIGLPSLEAFKIISLNWEIKETVTRPVADKADLIAQYPGCFTGIGKFEGQYHITLDPTVQPVIHPARRVPFALKPDIKAELDCMEQQGVIRKVGEGEPTEWVNSLVYRRKANGQLRICLDPKDLNKAIRRDYHVTPTLEEILPKFNGAKYFSILDAKSGYWNVELDEPSSYLTTFNSPFGRYRFLRMPFGLRMAQHVFQHRIDQLIEGCPGVTGIADDIVVFGRTKEEHDANLHTFMERCAAKGLNLNPEKIRIKEPDFKFFGVICSADGVRPDPKKTAAISDMPAPTSRQELLSFLGLATYMGVFLPNLSEKTAVLRDLTKKNAIF